MSTWRAGCSGTGHVRFGRRAAETDQSKDRHRAAARPHTQHRTGEGWVYAAVVLDVFSRRVVGWSIADHLRTELVIDALDMARWRRKPVGTTVHSDRGAQYTSWLFGTRLREAGLLGSMGKVACAYDNSLMESFFGSMQIELLDRRTWPTHQPGQRNLRMDRSVLQPHPATLRPELPQPHRLRSTPHRRPNSGIITTPKPEPSPVCWTRVMRLVRR